MERTTEVENWRMKDESTGSGRKAICPRLDLEVKSMDGLVANLGSHLPAWRTNAQDALIQEGLSVVPRLKTELAKTKVSKGHETWLVWTIGRIDPATWLDGNQNQLIQSIRVAAFNQRMRPEIISALKHSEPRIRLEAVLALRQISPPEAHIALLELAEVETDRIVNYAIWGALTDLLSVEEKKAAVGQKVEYPTGGASWAPRRRCSYGGRDRRIHQGLSFSNQKFSEEATGRQTSV